MSEDKPINEIGRILTKKFLLMNYPYSSLILEGQCAKQRLNQVFQAGADRRAASSSLPNIGSAPARNGQPNGSDWRREDMSGLSFTLTLLLLGTVAAAQTDQPVLWLLVGPVPLAVGLVAVAFLRRRFNLCAYLRGLRQRDVQSRGRYPRVGAAATEN